MAGDRSSGPWDAGVPPLPGTSLPSGSPSDRSLPGGAIPGQAPSDGGLSGATIPDRAEKLPGRADEALRRASPSWRRPPIPGQPEEPFRGNRISRRPSPLYPLPRSAPAAKKPYLDLEALRRARRSNALWQFNRPSRWSPRKRHLYWGMLAGGPIAAAVGSVISFALFPLEPALLLTVLEVVFLQIALCGGLIHLFDFVARRRWVLEDLLLTPLTIEQIAFGNYRIGTQSALWVFLMLIGVEVAAMGELIKSQGLMVTFFILFFLLAGQALLHCQVVQSSLETASRLGRQPGAYRFKRVLALFWDVATHWAIFFVVIFLLTFGSLFRFFFVVHLFFYVAAVGVMAAYIWIIHRATMATGYRAVMDNFRQTAAEPE